MIDYRQNHLQRIIKTNGSKVAFTYDELINCINKYIKNPELDSENRRKIVNNEIGAFKGNATKNISDIINKILNK